MSKIYKVGIIGGGISGSVIALQLAQNGVDNILFEQGESLVNGPPFCHLHAGGNLYPEISVEQCKQLMLQSIDMAKLFPQSIDERPTFISVPKSENIDVNKIEDKLKLLANYYQELISEDASNEVLGNPADYYKSYSHEDLVALAKQATVQHPKSQDEWMANAIKYIDYENLKMPVFLVQEYGWNLFRLAAQAQLALYKADACELHTHTKVININDVRNQQLDYNWEIRTKDAVYKVKYLVNSSGYKTAHVDKHIQLNSNRLVEYKAAYISKWHSIPGLIPEMIFHGERGSTHGMLQITPYNNDYYQIHGMTKDITLFDNGLIQSKKDGSPAEFDSSIKRKIAREWHQNEINTRTESAIRYAARYVPSFKSATVGGPPLHGAQQIPGDDPSLRVGEVSFPSDSYARAEIVKASSALTVARQIIQKIQEENIVPVMATNAKQNALLDSISKTEIDHLASELAIQRGYPGSLSQLLIERK
ncbi:FAD-dependent oxidoreductase [Parabacteroides sp. FAFU027]|uniref:FAD-dependent oxidoreductase n=1 Tax=Parabacteroides sp. FAFU027 TaxID=2922715 RepID=UPI001FB0438A|nr:FAD-dependent oxidoreductase [Parabacteroides sp. FAFU027]